MSVIMLSGNAGGSGLTMSVIMYRHRKTRSSSVT
jgi:hypothetical protein